MKDILLKKDGTDFTLRKYLTGLLASLQTVTTGLKAFETQEIQRARWNGQKMVLQEALNTLFGITAVPWIIIETNQDLGQNTYFYEELEDVDVFFSEVAENDPIYFFEGGEVAGSDYDFKVLVPDAIFTTENQRRIKAQVYLYKLAGPKFILENYV